MNLRDSLVQEAARILCEEQLTDYRIAKQKAAERLGVSGRSQLPDNAQIQQAVIEYQRLFGGDRYRVHLRRMRETALRVMKSLANFSPRLVGGAITGAVTPAHRVQLHAFADQAEAIDLYLHERGIAFDEDERSYRYPDGREQRVPLARLEVDGIGVDLALFSEADSRRAPVNPADGQPFRRLDAVQAQKLLEADGR
ncbi:MAG: hypothetical protein ACREE7_16215 [Dongiaceae bacterium]